MLRVSRLTLRRFRSHRLFDARFDGRPLAISGPNGAGKTNILEALSLLSPGRGLRGASAEDMAEAPQPIGWSISAELVEGESEEGDEPVHRVAVSAEQAEGYRRAVALDGDKATQTALGKLVSAVWLTPAMDRLWMEGATERRRFLDRAALALEPGHGQVVAGYEKAMRERNRLLKDLAEGGPSRTEASWLDAIERRMAEAGVVLAQTRARTLEALIAAQDAAAAEGPDRRGPAAFPSADLSLSGSYEDAAADAAGWGADRFADRLARERRMDRGAGRTLFGPHRSDLEAVYRTKGVAARLCSTGEQKALLVTLVLATARAAADASGRAPLLLLDEVAAHFDPDRRATLAEEILKLRAQVFLTGAEASLFDPFGDSAQRLLLGSETASGAETESAPE